MFSLDTTTTEGILYSMAFALLFGAVTAVVYAVKNRYSRNMFISLIVLPVAIGAVLTLINNNLSGGVGVGIAIAGAFSLLRFRSVPGTALDITYVFIALVSGVTAATGQVAYGGIAVGATLLILLIFKFIPDKKRKSNMRSLRLTVPESLNYAEAFEEVLKQYALSYELVKVKTTNMGSTFELIYDIMLKNGADEKQFIDDLRVRNGNLPISCSVLVGSNEQL